MSYRCCRASVAGPDGAGERDSGAVGAAVSAGSVECVGSVECEPGVGYVPSVHAGHVGHGCVAHAERGAVCGESCGQSEMGATGAPVHRCWGHCWGAS